MAIKACMPVIPSNDLGKSLRFWVDGLGLIATRQMHQDGRLVGCMVSNEYIFFWLNQRFGDIIPPEYEGIRLYWTPADIKASRDLLQQLGYTVSDITERDYGQTEFLQPTMMVTYIVLALRLTLYNWKRYYRSTFHSQNKPITLKILNGYS